uniref:Uncharacterized protein n=1 Tax=Mus musculus TaxID=10090 RepID=Q3TZX1_MOUSE|nr:unnamed protein product [Mus musculus]
MPGDKILIYMCMLFNSFSGIIITPLKQGLSARLSWKVSAVFLPHRTASCIPGLCHGGTRNTSLSFVMEENVPWWSWWGHKLCPVESYHSRHVAVLEIRCQPRPGSGGAHL